jgi:hypothetical protein
MTDPEPLPPPDPENDVYGYEPPTAERELYRRVILATGEFDRHITDAGLTVEEWDRLAWAEIAADVVTPPEDRLSDPSPEEHAEAAAFIEEDAIYDRTFRINGLDGPITVTTHQGLAADPPLDLESEEVVAALTGEARRPVTALGLLFDAYEQGLFTLDHATLVLHRVFRSTAAVEEILGTEFGAGPPNSKPHPVERWHEIDWFSPKQAVVVADMVALADPSGSRFDPVRTRFSPQRFRFLIDVGLIAAAANPAFPTDLLEELLADPLRNTAVVEILSSHVDTTGRVSAELSGEDVPYPEDRQRHAHSAVTLVRRLRGTFAPGSPGEVALATLLPDQVVDSPVPQISGQMSLLSESDTPETTPSPSPAARQAAAISAIDTFTRGFDPDGDWDEAACEWLRLLGSGRLDRENWAHGYPAHVIHAIVAGDHDDGNVVAAMANAFNLPELSLLRAVLHAPETLRPLHGPVAISQLFNHGFGGGRDLGVALDVAAWLAGKPELVAVLTRQWRNATDPLDFAPTIDSNRYASQLRQALLIVDTATQVRVVACPGAPTDLTADSHPLFFFEESTRALISCMFDGLLPPSQPPRLFEPLRVVAQLHAHRRWIPSIPPTVAAQLIRNAPSWARVE